MIKAIPIAAHINTIAIVVFSNKVSFVSTTPPVYFWHNISKTAHFVKFLAEKHLNTGQQDKIRHFWRCFLLPFLKKRESASQGIIVKVRQPDEKPSESEENQDDPSAAIKACAQSLINAVHGHNVQGVADAMADAFAILESMPHDEAESKEEAPAPHSYEAQDQE